MQEINNKNIQKIGKIKFLIRKQQRDPQTDRLITFSSCFDKEVNFLNLRIKTVARESDID